MTPVCENSFIGVNIGRGPAAARVAKVEKAQLPHLHLGTIIIQMHVNVEMFHCLLDIHPSLHVDRRDDPDLVGRRRV